MCLASNSRDGGPRELVGKDVKGRTVLFMLKQLKVRTHERYCKDKTTTTTRSGEMLQQLGVLTVLLEDPGLIPSIHMVAYNHLLTLVLGDLTPSLASVGTVST